MTTFVFPGQGSQQKGMGGELFDEFKELTAKADEILGYSIKRLCLEDVSEQLGKTQFTQPALYTVNAFTYLKKTEKSAKKPDFLAGHSLGEYAALFAAGAFDFETGLKLVKKRGGLMSRATGGGMAAVIGLHQEQIGDILKQNNLPSIDIANYNSPAQIVISGPNADIERAKAIFERIKGVMVVRLKTSGAFHSRHMEAAKKEFEFFLSGLEFSALEIPVVSNVHAKPHKHADIKQTLAEQITHPVKWEESIRYLMGIGEMEFEEIGPGKVLTSLIQKIKKEAPPLLIKYVETESTKKDAPPTSEAESVKNPKETISVKDNQASLPMKQDGLEVKTKKDASSSLAKIVGKLIENVQEKAKELASANPKERKEGNQKSLLAEEEKNTAGATVSKGEKGKMRKEDGQQVQKALPEILPLSLGCSEFKKDYNLTYAYLTGAMYRGIASKEMVVKMGKAGMMGFLGTGGLALSQIEDAIQYIRKELPHGNYGMNFLHNPNNPEMEEKTVDLFLTHGVKNIEAAAFMNLTPALIRYHAKGLKQAQGGIIITTNKIIAKISRPEVAEAFLSPASERILTKLLAEKKITPEEAELSKRISVADDICAESDSGGHTDGAVAYALLPAIIKLRDEMMEKHKYHKKVRVGAAGGIGTPEAAAAAFMLGADFIVTGSINQCTVEAGTSDTVKDLLQQMNVQDTEYAPAGDMFELGAKVQVLKKGLFFPARANKLYDLYRQYNSLEEIDEKTKAQIQEKYFKCSFDKVYGDVKRYYPAQEIEKAERSQKHKMALIFRWYFGYTSRLALTGDLESKVDYQVHCGPALGAFNQWVKGTRLENWRNRHVDEIGKKLMEDCALVLSRRFQAITSV